MSEIPQRELVRACYAAPLAASLAVSPPPSGRMFSAGWMALFAAPAAYYWTLIQRRNPE